MEQGFYMLNKKTASILDCFKIKNIVDLYNNSNLDSFYNVNIPILSYLFLKKCYYILRGNRILGIVFIDSKVKNIYYIPKVMYRVMPLETITNFLYSNFNISGYIMHINYIKKQYINKNIIMPAEIKENIKFMHIKTYKDKKYSLKENEQIRKINIFGNEEIRVCLQNKIFEYKNIKGRINLTINDILSEESSPYFLKDYCFLLEKNNNSCGYAQIILIENNFFLVNFGIVPEERGRGLGNSFLNEIINICFQNKIEDLYLTVDNSNKSAIKLYTTAGFKEKYNTVTVKYN
jgi:GNAT superfamily N-acetyltransferase